MSKRKSISKKLRFEIFKRDLFTCQYCGSMPPSVVLEIDHVIPVSSGGENDDVNLLTSCFDCNRGKGARSLSEAPQALANKIKVQREKEDQLKELEKLLARKRSLLKKNIVGLEVLFNEKTGRYFTDSFKTSIKMFFDKLTKIEIHESMEIALSRIDEPEKIVKYFCGICWNKIRDRDNA